MHWRIKTEVREYPVDKLSREGNETLDLTIPQSTK